MNILDDPEARAYLTHAEREMLPKMKASAISVTLFTGSVDIKLCLEVGAAILFDKPIIVVACGDRPIPANLKRVASVIIERAMQDEDTNARIQAAIAKVLAEDRRAQEPHA